MSAADSSTDTKRGSVRRAKDWVFITGSRRLLSGLFVAGVVVLTAGLIRVGALNVGPNSTAYSVFGSGFVAGLLTLETVALSVNQLILSRLFGSPGELKETVESSVEFRSTVERIAGEPSGPTDPGEYLGLLGQALQEEVGDFQRHLSGADPDLGSEFVDYTATLVRYGGNLSRIDSHQSVVQVLQRTLVTEYGTHLARTRELQNRYRHEIPEEALDSLEAIADLLESTAALKQFYETITVQQDLAILSRRLIFLGVFALLTCVYVALAYTTGSVLSIPPGLRAWVISAALGIAMSPLVLLTSHLLRIATISLYTVSTGPYRPPKRRYEGAEGNGVSEE